MKYLTISERIQDIRSGNHTPKAVWKFSDFAGSFPEGGVHSMTIRGPFCYLLWVFLPGRQLFSQSAGEEYLLQEYPYGRGIYHKHEFIEILYVVEGSFDQILLGEQLHFSAGDVIITDQNCEHADVTSDSNSSVLFLQIRSDDLDRLLRSFDGSDELMAFLFHSLRSQKTEQSFLWMVPETGEYDRKLEELLEMLHQESLAAEIGSEWIRDGLLLRLLWHLCKTYTMQLHSASRQGKEQALLYEVERYIRLHPSCVCAQELENTFHYHRNYFNLLLRKYRECTLKQYIQEVRLNYARQLLEQSDLPVRQIAREVGYENTSFFYQIFRKKYGCSPGEIGRSASEQS